VLQASRRAEGAPVPHRVIESPEAAAVARVCRVASGAQEHQPKWGARVVRSRRPAAVESMRARGSMHRRLISRAAPAAPRHADLQGEAV